MKNFRVVTALLIALIVIFSMFEPTMKVFAENNYNITFTVSGNHEIIPNVQPDGTNRTGEIVIDGKYVSLINANNESVGEVEVSKDGKSAVIKVTSGEKTKLAFNAEKSFSLFVDKSQYDMNSEFSNNASITIQDYVENTNGGNESGDSHNDEPHGDNNNHYSFNGNVYFVWATEGESNNFYYHRLENIISGTEINYVKLSSVKDDTNGTQYNISNRERNQVHADGKQDRGPAYHFVYDGALQVALEDQAFATATTTGKMDYLFENGMTIDPTGAVNGKKTVCTNGDRSFRLTIYDDSSYEGLKVGTPTGNKYMPAFWDTTFHSDTVDLTESTKAEPAVYEAFLLEKTIQINSDAISKNITNVKALNVPTGAINITDAGSGKWNITYNSNYYDNSELELTDTDGNKYYIVLARINVRGKGAKDGAVFAEVFYPSTDSYTDYSVVVTVNFKDGTTKTSEVKTPSKTLESEGGDKYDTYEISGGTNLKCAWYQVPGITQGKNSKAESFYVTVIKKGALQGKSYGGTFAGSGNGIKYEDKGQGFKPVYK